MSDSSVARLRTWDCIVVGAGLSGLAAADMLVEAGCTSVLVLEARNRVGGRTFSVPATQCLSDIEQSCATTDCDNVDLGGQWVGPKQQRMLKLIDTLGLQLVQQPWFEDVWQSQETGLPGDTATAAATTTAAATPRSLSSGSLITPAQLQTDNAADAATSLATELQAAMQLLDTMAMYVQDPVGPSREAVTAFGDSALTWPHISFQDWLRQTVHKTAAGPLCTTTQPSNEPSGCPEVNPKLVTRSSNRQGLQLSSLVAEELALFVRTVLACEPTQVSMQFLLFYIHCSQGVEQLADGSGGAQTWRIRGGALQLSQRLADQVRSKGGTILLNHPAASVAVRCHCSCGNANNASNSHQHQHDIDKSSNGSSNLSSSIHTHTYSALHSAADCAECSGPHTVTVSTADGTVFQARQLIVAIPPSLWHHITWKPCLPHRFHSFGNRMKMGCAVKCVALYNTPWWAQLPAPKHGRLERMGPVCNLFPAQYPLSDVCTAKDTGSTSRMLHGLVCLVTAAAAEQFALLDDEERRKQVLAQLALYFGCNAALQPVGFITKEWMSEPWSQGCYGGYMPPHCPPLETHGKPGAILGSNRDNLGPAAGQKACMFSSSLEEQCTGRVIHFAGTEMSLQWTGYMEGALAAAETAVAAVLQSYGSTCKQPSRCHLTSKI